ncbi:Ig-like and fibronectin type-III domain-containing protein 2 isoform X2 [Tachypleus tridentatus]
MIWKRVGNGKATYDVLTAGNIRVTTDQRISVIHEPGHSTWILKISSSTEQDSGRYICEVNTALPLRVYRILTVVDAPVSTPFSIKHNYKDCCVKNGVPSSCLSLCNFHDIILGYQPEPGECMDYVKTIVSCLADGRDHMPCCVRENIPEICRSVCIGDYQISTVLQHYTCVDYTISTLACVAEGIDILPGSPQNFAVNPLSSDKIEVTWTRPYQLINVNHYELNVTKLHSFDDLGYVIVNEDTESRHKEGKSVVSDQQEGISTSIHVVNGNESTILLRNLQPQTMYELFLTAVNRYGRSLPTYSVRTLTLSPTSATRDAGNLLHPQLPDIPLCCKQQGVNVDHCLQYLCNPVFIENTNITQIVICAPFVNVTFKCMAGGVDHTSCCQHRGVPEICLEFCSGHVKSIDFRHFICLEYMSVYSNCLLDHYRVLPSAPQNLTLGSIDSKWAILLWSPPSYLSHTVKQYILHWREARADGVPAYSFRVNVKSPFLFDGLKPSTRYEVYLVAENSYGTSESSSRLLFTTSSQQPAEVQRNQVTGYNETDCCVRSSVKQACLPLCTYEVTLSNLYKLTLPCLDEVGTVIRCTAGGRDHVSCCQRRGVTSSCLGLCAGKIEISSENKLRKCQADLGKILQCMEEGTDVQPMIPQDVHITLVTTTTVHLRWSPPGKGPDVVGYQIRYQLTPEGIPLKPLEFTKFVNTTKTTTVIAGLQPGTYYSFYVLSYNNYGFSLPSLVAVVRTSLLENKTDLIKANLSPPHSVVVNKGEMNNVLITWSPPEYVPLEASLYYTVYYQPANQTESLMDSNTTISTVYNSETVGNLSFNTQYAVAVQAHTEELDSQLSEVVLFWTNPAVAAFVHPPVIIPSGQIMEGSNISILCVGIGMPLPTVSIYVDGKLCIEDQNRHLSFTIPYIRHNVTSVSCYADNGFGHGAQSTRRISVNFRPYIRAITPNVQTAQGSIVILKCEVSAFPEPRILWYKGSDQKQPVKRGDNTKMELIPKDEVPATYISSLELTNFRSNDAGNFVCYAENIHGVASVTLHVQIEELTVYNTSVCCQEQNVSQECRHTCSFDVDIQAALGKPECIKDLDKLMFCATDGRDHRKCCKYRRVPRSCLKWCIGRPVFSAPMCVLMAANDIVSCFEEGKAVIPGPPKNVRVAQLSPRVIQVKWDPPLQNPQFVEWYRVIWKHEGSESRSTNQTTKAALQVNNLTPGITYQLFVKAGNHYGISDKTKPVKFTVSDDPTFLKHSDAAADIAVKVVSSIVAVAFVILLTAGGVCVWRRNKKRASTGVSFENPTFLKDSISLQNTMPPTNEAGVDKIGELGSGQSDNSESQVNNTRAISNLYEEPKHI